MILVHASWLAGLWALGYDRAVVPAYLVAFLVLHLGRYWVLATLGRRWTTRVIVLPGAPLIESGPYRLMRHPNYVIVAGELMLVPLALGLPVYAIIFLALYAGAAHLRIQVENSALAWAPEGPAAWPRKRKRPHKAGAVIGLETAPFVSLGRCPRPPAECPSG
jgi:methyltransferase